MLGNWRELLEWDSGGLSYATAEEREHSDANELEQITVGSDELEFTYDNAGNLTERELTPTASVTYIYDAWNRLVRVKYGSSDRAKYRYNGLNWRIEKHADTSMPPDGDLNQRREMYYSANWQLLEERIDDDALAQDPPPEINRHMQYVWGPRYIDDIVARRQNSDFENDEPDITYEDVWYHLTDAQFSTVAVIDEGAVVIERVSYDAYGRARHHRGADLDGDGDVDISDYFLLDGNRGEYGLGDVDRNGIVNVLDQLDLFEQWGDALEPGQLSITDNIIGYAGYVFNAEHHGSALYTVRFRVYSPDLGRWLTRDPLGYVDGMSLYEYVRSASPRGIDPFGAMSAHPPGMIRDPLMPIRPIERWLRDMLTPSPRQNPDERACRAWAEEQALNEQSAGRWWESLPPCPCSIKDEVECDKWFELEDREGQWYPFDAWTKYHPKGRYQRRSQPACNGCPGQQCVYDEDGKLITGGRSAGTPDWVAPVWDVIPVYSIAGTLVGPDLTYVYRHREHDVDPFESCRKAGLLDLYFRHRPPNNVLECDENIKD